MLEVGRRRLQLGTVIASVKKKKGRQIAEGKRARRRKLREARRQRKTGGKKKVFSLVLVRSARIILYVDHEPTLCRVYCFQVRTSSMK